MHLARFDHQGSSAGWWLVREAPGAYIFALEGGWGIDCSPSILSSFPERAREVWGESYRPCRLGLCLGKIYRTRAEALLALEAELSGEPSSSLAGVLS